MALRLASKALRPWVPVDQTRRLLADALPLVGALSRGGEEEAEAEAGEGERGAERRQRFVASVPPEEPASEVRVGPWERSGI